MYMKQKKGSINEALGPDKYSSDHPSIIAA
jgi:hypothetical protein